MRTRVQTRSRLCLGLCVGAVVACGGSHPPADDALEVEVDVPCPEASAAPEPGPVHWEPGTITRFQILHFETLAELQRRLQPADVVTLELDQVVAAGGTAVTDAAHAQGTRVSCYISTGYEDWRDDAASYPADARGGPICRDDACDETWPGEAWGDIRKPSLIAFLDARAGRAAAAGCDGIEFDNMDQAFNRTGLGMSVEENIGAAQSLARLAHDHGLGAMAKNTGELACHLAPSFDGVFIEECQAEEECDVYLPYSGKLVAMVEYEARCTERAWAPCRRQSDYFEE